MLLSLEQFPGRHMTLRLLYFHYTIIGDDTCRIFEFINRHVWMSCFWVFLCTESEVYSNQTVCMSAWSHCLVWRI